MIYSLNGKLIENEPNTAVVECGGVGYKCTVSLKTSSALPKIGENVFLYTYLAIREDAADLFGFINKDEMRHLNSLHRLTEWVLRLVLLFFLSLLLSIYIHTLLQVIIKP